MAKHFVDGAFVDSRVLELRGRHADRRQAFRGARETRRIEARRQGGAKPRSLKEQLFERVDAR